MEPRLLQAGPQGRRTTRCAAVRWGPSWARRLSARRARQAPLPSSGARAAPRECHFPNSHGARPVHLIITMMLWIRTSRLSIQNPLSLSATLPPCVHTRFPFACDHCGGFGLWGADAIAVGVLFGQVHWSALVLRRPLAGVWLLFTVRVDRSGPNP